MTEFQPFAEAHIGVGMMTQTIWRGILSLNKGLDCASLRPFLGTLPANSIPAES
jgi:hypothetical protein